MSSTADIDDVLEVSTDGITVRKRFVAAAFPVPAIRFEIDSDHDDAVFVRFSERIPDRFPMEKIGFHPEYHSEGWTAFQDNHIEFAGTLEAGESLVTVYGMQIDEDDVDSEFLGEPTILEVRSDDSAGEEPDEGMPDRSEEGVPDRSDEDADAAPESDERPPEDDDAEQADDAVVSAESDGDDGRESRDDTGAGTTTVDPVATDSTPEAPSDDEIDHRIDVSTDSDDASDPSDEIDVGSDAPEDAAAGDEPIDADGSESSPTPVESSERALTTRLAAELRAGTVEESELETLRTELAVDLAPSDRAKVEHLQLRVEELDAYTNALEQFLDEEGTGQQLTERFAAVEGDLDTVTDRLEDTESRVDDLETDLEAVRDDLTEIQAWRDQLGSMFSDR